MSEGGEGSTPTIDQNPNQFLKSPERENDHILELGRAYQLPNRTTISIVKTVGNGPEFIAWHTGTDSEGRMYINTISGSSTQEIYQLEAAISKGHYTVEQIEALMENYIPTTENEIKLLPKFLERGIKELRLLAAKKENRLVTSADLKMFTELAHKKKLEELQRQKRRNEQLTAKKEEENKKE